MHDLYLPLTGDRRQLAGRAAATEAHSAERIGRRRSVRRAHRPMVKVPIGGSVGTAASRSFPRAGVQHQARYDASADAQRDEGE
jgi:hypothetical protein